MDWFRFYSGALHKRKVQELPPVLLRRGWNLLCLARMSEGSLPPLPDIAFHLHCSDKQADSWLQALTKARLFELGEDGRVHPHDWAEHQYCSDNSTSRVSRYRERTRELGSKVGGYLKHKDESSTETAALVCTVDLTPNSALTT